MMRTIKFRGRDFAGMWHIGDLIHNDDDLLIRKGCFSIYIENETAGQFTGLFDKNGKEIYEGDIVQLDNGGFDVVSWGTVAFQTALSLSSEPNGIMSEYKTIFDGIKVIGNIHDNPELLKQ